MPELTINGESHALDVPVGTTLAEGLRDELGLTGTKVACAEGHCGACTVLLDGVPVYSCITLVHMVGEREVTTIEGLREHPLVEAFVRTDALQCGFCTPGQIVSASALVASEPGAERGRDPARDGRESVPLRHISEDRGGDCFVARLIRTEKEVEGRYEEVWLVVEEDALEQWPAGPREVVGRDAAAENRADARPRRGSLHGRHPASRHAPRRCAALSTRSRSCKGDFVRQSAGGARREGHGRPRRSGRAHGRARLQGQAVAAVAADTIEQARKALDLVEVEWEVLEPLLDPDEAVPKGQLVGQPSHYERATSTGPSRRRTSS